MTTPKMTDAASAVLGQFLTAVPDLAVNKDRFGMTSETTLPYGSVTFADTCRAVSITLVRNDINGRPVEKYDVGVNPNGSTFVGVSVTKDTNVKTGRRHRKNTKTTGLRCVSDTKGKFAEGIEDYLTQIIGSMENPCVPAELGTLVAAMPQPATP